MPTEPGAEVLTEPSTLREMRATVREYQHSHHNEEMVDIFTLGEYREIVQYLDALRARCAQLEGEAGETAWVVVAKGVGRNSGELLYLSAPKRSAISVNGYMWSDDHLQAIRFSREVDADAFVRVVDGPPLTIVESQEHMWMDRTIDAVRFTPTSGGNDAD